MTFLLLRPQGNNSWFVCFLFCFLFFSGHYSFVSCFLMVHTFNSWSLQCPRKQLMHRETLKVSVIRIDRSQMYQRCSPKLFKWSSVALLPLPLKQLLLEQFIFYMLRQNDKQWFLVPFWISFYSVLHFLHCKLCKRTQKGMILLYLDWE